MGSHDTGRVAYPTALLITLAVEVPVYAVVLRFARLLPGWRGVAAAVGVNVVTHPPLWWVVSAHPGWLVAAEACVVVVEAGLLWLLAGRRDARLLLVTAVAANTASVLAGIVLNGLR
jgi:hypothetical protein